MKIIRNKFDTIEICTGIIDAPHNIPVSPVYCLNKPEFYLLGIGGNVRLCSSCAERIHDMLGEEISKGN